MWSISNSAGLKAAARHMFAPFIYIFYPNHNEMSCLQNGFTLCDHASMLSCVGKQLHKIDVHINKFTICMIYILKNKRKKYLIKHDNDNGLYSVPVFFGNQT